LGSLGDGVGLAGTSAAAGDSGITRDTIVLLYRRVPLFHHIDVRVAWPDTDPAGIVWFGVFFRYFENAEEDLYRRLGRERTDVINELKIFMPRTSLQSRFRSPAKLGDALAVGIGVADMTDRRIAYAFDIRERGTGRLICEASYRVACVDSTTFAARPFPREVVDLLAPARVDEQRPTANDQRPTTNDQRATTNDQRPTTDDQRPTTDDQRPTTNDQRPDDQRPTTND
jgi:YbgC/YbaW family acyl-CoA thioester hydrolase